MLLCQERIFLRRHFKQDAVVDVAVVLVNNSQQFVGILSPNLFPLFFNRWFSRYVIAAMLVDSKQKIAH